MDSGIPFLQLRLKQTRDIVQSVVCIITTRESFWVTRQLSKVKVVVDMDAILLCMSMKFVVPVANSGGIMCFGSRLWGPGDEHLLFLFIPFGGEVEEIT